MLVFDIQCLLTRYLIMTVEHATSVRFFSKVEKGAYSILTL